MALPALSPSAQVTLNSLEESLPPHEWRAVHAWLHTFYRFQLEWLLDWGRFSIVLKSRQIGNSHTIAAAAVLWGLFGETTTVISLGQREADEVLEKCKLHAEALAELGSLWSRKRQNSVSKLVLASGGRILSLPLTSAGRSFSGNVILDEIAYYERPEKVWDGAGGTALHGYRLRPLSTPNGTGNFFHQLWSDPKKNRGYTKHAVTIDDAIADGMAVDLEDCWKLAHGDPRVFDQMFRCSFLDNDQQYIPSAAIEACSFEGDPPEKGRCYAGLDIGKTADRTELIIVRRDSDDRLWEVHNESCKRTSPEDIERLAARAFEHPWRCLRLCVDSTGMGAFPADRLRKRYGRKVEPFNFTMKTKEELATGLYSSFTQDRIRVSKDNTQLRDDLRSIRRIITTAGNVRYDAPHTAEGHADSAWALALAIHGHLPSKSGIVGTERVLPF